MFVVKRKPFGYVFNIQGMNPTSGNYKKKDIVLEYKKKLKLISWVGRQ